MQEIIPNTFLPTKIFENCTYRGKIFVIFATRILIDIDLLDGRDFISYILKKDKIEERNCFPG